jgi:serine protease Do
MNKESREKVAEEKRGIIGIKGLDVNETAAAYYNMPYGVYIKEVIKDGAAEKAGISKGSIITKFEGSSIKNMNALQDALSYYKSGETVELEIAVPNSDGEYEKTIVKVTLQKAKN